MAEVTARRVWTGRLRYAVIALAILFFQLLPLQTLPRNWGAPDILLLVTLAFAARRPDHVPALLVAAAMLLSDMLLQRPPGLWTGLVLILTELLRSRARSMRSLPFPLEWGFVAIGIGAITLANRAILAILLVPVAPMGLTLTQLAITIVAYPIVVALAHFALRVNRPAQGAVDEFGHRL
ncbi:MAG: rod shape-determining protein MreD [Rhodobacteraceae bacterium HLUCCA08]|nr:MAG: rod shape-determining protein MreD [Rhodobacteraceae bacterium HLUCCA08]